MAILRAVLLLALSLPVLPQEVPPLPANLGKKTVLIGGVAFAEGPTFDSKGNFYFTNYLRRGTIGRMTPDGTVSVWFTLDRGAPNGLRVDHQDRVLVCDQDGGRLLRVNAEGTRMEVLAETFEGKPLNGPNDVIVDRDGNIYFTDPKGSNAQKRIGGLYRLRTNGKLERLLTGLAFPNGLAITPDGKSLYYVESYLSRLSAFDFGPGGEVANHRALAQFLPHPLDGIAFDEHSRLWITHYTAGSIEVVSRDGEFLKSYDAGGERVSNLCFREGKLYVTPHRLANRARVRRRAQRAAALTEISLK
ncbi:MAG: SMP-30/gluconolactonase/LRE family protein [Bryobacterales bacterium]|nr:SMP-30/gluconolactonase/LRE family protein [Bryobacterales bacterium]